jgi:RNA polymerase sigma-70 factor (ECF subfamily)
MDLERDIRRAFETAMLPHLDAAFNLARWLTRDDLAAEDVVQEAYCRALRFFASFRGGDGRPWLLAVVRRAAFDWLAQRKRSPLVAFDEANAIADESFNPEVLALRKAAGDEVRQAIEELSPEFREVLVLRELEGLSYQEIATVASVPLGTVMSRLSRAREQLQRRLMRSYGGEV